MDNVIYKIVLLVEIVLQTESRAEEIVQNGMQRFVHLVLSQSTTTAVNTYDFFFSLLRWQCVGMKLLKLDFTSFKNQCNTFASADHI